MIIKQAVGKVSNITFDLLCISSKFYVHKLKKGKGEKKWWVWRRGRQNERGERNTERDNREGDRKVE